MLRSAFWGGIASDMQVGMGSGCCRCLPTKKGEEQ